MARQVEPPVAGRGKQVAVLGGGLAGLAAAAALCESGFQVELFESRRQLGGRAGSFVDPEDGGFIDHCQHVGMACCTNLLDFCRRTGVDRYFQRHGRLNFYGPDGRLCVFQQSAWLPAPLHLAPSLWKMTFLSRRDRLAVARGLWRLMRLSNQDTSLDSTTVSDWLCQQGQSEAAVRRLWGVVLVSALGESVERISLAAARKVFVDGFMRARGAYAVDLPRAPLAEIYGHQVAGWLRERGVHIHLGRRVRALQGSAQRVTAVCCDAQPPRPFDFFVLSLPWRRVTDVLSPEMLDVLPQLQTASELASSSITALHMWFDRPLMQLPHAVLVDRLSQWDFNRGTDDSTAAPCWYCQVVISASGDLAQREQQSIVDEVLRDLAAVWPENAGQARLLRWNLVCERDAVFSWDVHCLPRRPPQTTAIANLMLAGDWTDTGWPSTMEGAVRSGYLAAEHLMRAAGCPRRVLLPDVKAGWLARILIA
jgi:squalene-associated FAD-dependent desaturase